MLLVGILSDRSGERRWISKGLDRTFAPTGGFRAPVWDGDDVLVLAEDRGDANVYRVPTGGAGAPRAITPVGGTTGSFDFAAGVLAFARAELDRPSEVWLHAAGATEAHRISTVTDRFGVHRPASRAQLVFTTLGTTASSG